MIAINVAAAFISVYLYQNDYSVQFIALYWCLYYTLKIFLALPLAHYAARFGAKHGMLLSNLLYIPSMIAFTLVPEYGMAPLFFTGVLQAVSATLYNMCYYINFSQVKTPTRAGRELAFMNIFEKVATGISPLVGGFLALYFGPASALWAAAGFFALAAIPLFFSGEPHETDRRLVFRGFPWRLARRSLFASIGIGSDASVVRIPWPLFIGIVIVGIGSSNKIYAVLGVLASIVVIADIAFSYTYGALIDRKRGGILLRAGISGDILVHLARPFTTTVFGVGAVNVANEATATGYMMAFMRGMFDVADRTGHRATYIGLIEVMQDFGAALLTGSVLLLVSLLGEANGLRYSFFVAAGLACLIYLARFPLYRKP